MAGGYCTGQCSLEPLNRFRDRDQERRRLGVGQSGPASQGLFSCFQAVRPLTGSRLGSVFQIEILCDMLRQLQKAREGWAFLHGSCGGSCDRPWQSFSELSCKSGQVRPVPHTCSVKPCLAGMMRKYKLGTLARTCDLESGRPEMEARFDSERAVRSLDKSLELAGPQFPHL